MPIVIPGPDTTPLDRLKRMVAWDMAPELTEDELGDLLHSARRIDASGLLPSDDGWTATYDLTAAARAGWELKLGMCATAAIDFAEDGQSFKMSQQTNAIKGMIVLYSTGTGSVDVPSVVRSVMDVAAAV